MNKGALVAGAVLAAITFSGSLQAAMNRDAASAMDRTQFRAAASEKRESEGTKADVRENKVEAKATTSHKRKHGHRREDVI